MHTYPYTQSSPAELFMCWNCGKLCCSKLAISEFASYETCAHMSTHAQCNNHAAGEHISVHPLCSHTHTQTYIYIHCMAERYEQCVKANLHSENSKSAVYFLRIKIKDEQNWMECVDKQAPGAWKSYEKHKHKTTNTNAFFFSSNEGYFAENCYPLCRLNGVQVKVSYLFTVIWCYRFVNMQFFSINYSKVKLWLYQHL